MSTPVPHSRSRHHLRHECQRHFKNCSLAYAQTEVFLQNEPVNNRFSAKLRPCTKKVRKTGKNPAFFTDFRAFE
jgi:hypothetical protein